VNVVRVLIGIGCIETGALMTLRFRRVGDWLERLRWRLVGRVGALDEYMTPTNVTTLYQANAIVAGLLLIVIGVVNIATAWR
jgi:hypothetical protein